MKVTAIRPQIVFGAWRNWVFVELDTDAGLVGLGEATLEGKERAVMGAIEDLGRYLIGRDPTLIETNWLAMYRDSYWRKGGVLNTALGALDIAMWDLHAQALEVPIHRLLGGPVRDKVPAYANGWYFGASTVEEFVARAVSTVEDGFRALKWDPFGLSYMTVSRAEQRFALDCVGAVREAVGPDVELLIEGHGRFNPATAIKLARQLEAFDIGWFEEPTPPDTPTMLTQVANNTDVPLAAGERLYTRAEFADLLAQQLVSFIQPDILHCGGFSEARKIAAMAEAYGVPVCPHNAAGPVGTAITLQLAACTPNFLWLEYFYGDAPWRDEVCLPAIEVKNGFAAVPSAPGLGLSLNQRVATLHPYQARDLHFFDAGSTLNSDPRQAR